jgi:hypothetical protein
VARLRVCAEPGCPELSEGRRCPEHATQREQARGTRQQRGYGVSHYRRRDALKRRVESGLETCARCQLPILPGDEWALDHTDDREGYLGPSHKICNDRAGGQAAHR